MRVVKHKPELFVYLEPGLLADLERRVSAAESKFLEADLELRLEELEQAKQKQVHTYTRQLYYKYTQCQVGVMKTIYTIYSNIKKQ